MQPINFEEVLDTILTRDSRYHRDAYLFLRGALDFVQKPLAKARKLEVCHVTGQQLVEGIRAYALEHFDCPLPIKVRHTDAAKGKIMVTGNSNYGGTPHTIARVLKVEIKLIEEFQARYFKAFPNILVHPEVNDVCADFVHECTHGACVCNSHTPAQLVCLVGSLGSGSTVMHTDVVLDFLTKSCKKQHS